MLESLLTPHPRSHLTMNWGWMIEFRLNRSPVDRDGLAIVGATEDGLEICRDRPGEQGTKAEAESGVRWEVIADQFDFGERWTDSTSSNGWRGLA